MSGTIAMGAPPGLAGQTTTVSSCALAAYASHQARWNAQLENGVDHGLRAASASHVSRGISRTDRRSTLSGSPVLPGSMVSVGVGQAGSASRVMEVTRRMLHRPSE